MSNEPGHDAKDELEVIFAEARHAALELLGAGELFSTGEHLDQIQEEVSDMYASGTTHNSLVEVMARAAVLAIARDRAP